MPNMQEQQKNAARLAAAVEPSARGWLAALADAYHEAKASGKTHTAEKLQEVLTHLAGTPEPLRVGALTAGAVDEPHGSRDMWTAAIDIPGHGNAIECYGATEQAARALRDAVLATRPSVSRIGSSPAPEHSTLGKATAQPLPAHPHSHP